MTNDNNILTNDSLALIQRAEQGLIPSDLAGCAWWLEVADGLERGAAAMRWVAIAAARRCPELAESATGRGKRSPWIEWVMLHYTQYGNPENIHHMGAVGDLLIRAHKVCCAQHTLADLGFNRLISLARLPENLLVPFLAQNDVERLDRDAVRAKVNKWLRDAGVEEGEKPGTRSREGAKGGARHQPDFLDVLFAHDPEETPKMLFTAAEKRLAKADVAHAQDALDRSLAVAGAAIDRVIETATAQELAPYAETFRRALEQVQLAMVDKGGI